MNEFEEYELLKDYRHYKAGQVLRLRAPVGKKLIEEKIVRRAPQEAAKKDADEK